MSEKYHIVPWYNSKEWHKVYNDICSENSDKQDALNLIQMWKARCPSLPSGIESTLSLLQVHIQDVNCTNDFANDQILRLAYSSAVMRFVNHMLDAETAKGNSLYNAAKNAGVPDWIVDLRHDTAHNNSLPSIDLLRSASQISLQWLQKNYWNKHKEFIRDYTSGQKEVHSSDENKIAAIIHYCSCLSICAHSKIKKLTDITDASMQESIVTDARDLFGDLIDLSNLKTVSIGSLINLINTQSKKILKSRNTMLYVNKALLGEESLFLSLELLEHLSKNDFNNKNKLHRSYVMCFEVLLSFLHSNDLILEFILALVEMTQSDDGSKKTKLAALWISEILTALMKSKEFVERANKMNSVGATSQKKKDLKVLYHHWFPNEKEGLVLDLQKPVPTKLTDINFIQPIISSYNPYLTYFLKDLLNLAEPQLPQRVSNKICKLARLISTPEIFPSQLQFAKIYTVEDLKSEEMIIDEHCDKLRKSSQIRHAYTEEEHLSGIWKIASTHNWQSCPIGKVPWQDQSLDIEME